MTNKQKVKGSTWERDAVNILTSLIKSGTWKRIPGSGAMGTALGESLLTGDITGSVNGYPKKFKAECKVGYNPSTDKEVKSFSLKKEWLDKIRMESETAYATPILLGKFDNARGGVKHFVVMDIRDFADIMNFITDISRELELEYGKKSKKGKGQEK
jgi:hypothetical protein